MKINELIKNSNDKTFNLEKILEVKKYIPVIEKKNFVMDILATCTDEIDGCITVDKFKMNLYFGMKILGLYTNLEVESNFEDMVAQYDVLKESGLFDKSIGLFESEYIAIEAILYDELEMLLSQNSIDVQVVRIANKINTVIDMIGDKLNGVDFNSILPEGTDISELINMIGLLK